jgi:carboxyl-terminal processing protease
VSVSSEILDDNIGYIQVEQFYENTDEEFEEKFDELLAEGVDGVIIDLRDNPGGLLDSVVNMCDYIMGEGTIVTVKDRDDNVIQEYTSSADSEVDIPMVVLVNGNSASASEIFTGAMKDTGKAEIVGTTTFGKGIVQSVIPLSDGSAIKLTIAKYFTPAGNDIHKVGIEPDYVVELADGRLNAVNLDREDDLQLQKAEELLTK